jgi:hypothetical protein
MAAIKFWIIQNFIAVDQLINALLFGYADETLSSRAYRTEKNNKVFGKFFRPIIDTILFFDKNHCYWAYMAEVQKRQLPREFSKF